MLRPWLGVLLLVFSVAAVAQAAQTVHLPDHWCGGTDGIFADSYETGGVFTSDPSHGSDGSYPGDQQRSFTLAPFGLQTYYVHVPPAYQPDHAMPVMVVLEGAAGSHANAVQQAKTLRSNWTASADAYGFIVAVPVANGASGGWLAPDGSSSNDDYDAIGKVLDDLGQAWNIERNRVSVWGFSAGGHIAWDMLLNHELFPRPTPLHAGNLASLSVSGANSNFACSLGSMPCTLRFANLGRQVPVDIHIGNSDPNQPGAAQDQQYLLDNGWTPGDTLSFNMFVGGHTFTLAHLEQVAGFACRFAVAP